MLNITSDFTQDEISNWIKEDLNSIIYEMGEVMFKAGCKVVDLARAKTKNEGGFGNITWNLRGSIGCLLLIDHNIPDEFIYFPPVSKGEEGRQKGIDYAREIALLVDDGAPVLIIVAGEEYAGYVQDMEDYDVIDGSTKRFDSLLKQILS
ncbi:hypothetical protein [Pedobacter zeae]|uniref:Uncharacterized protein n=1 Tax=Pedobacter zeae TaxID=1737356 RepID=A0A7W6P583_9SPHI|nr:hypothetical protein [Pedobacter zeae]MBB4108334.1 hypothetical protein [Pedobacter zeae]GGG93482.1 hypothetical protein GCM10007422_03390 [Pedobacter zeae]